MRFTLWAEGNSDACLMPILEWLLRQNGVRDEIEMNDSEHFFSKSTYKTIDSIFEGEGYWSDLLFVHHDADANERANIESRKDLLDGLVTQAKETNENIPPHVVVIPVWETETWLLVSKAAILSALGCREITDLPGRNRLEAIRDPKYRLCQILRDSGFGIGTNEVDTEFWKNIVASIKKTEPLKFGVLRGIPSFDTLEERVKAVISTERLDQR